MQGFSKLVCWPHIHSEIIAKAHDCVLCTDKGKKLKALLPNTQLGSIPMLVEPNHEIQMDIAGPVPLKENTQNNYILVTVDRL